MNTAEFSSAFDIRLNSFGGTQSIVLDEYEKSLFLTEAQNQIVVELYTGRNERGASFEGTEELRSCLRNLIREASLKEVTDVKSDYRSKIFSLPPDLLFITYDEALIDDCKAGCHDGVIIQAVPVTHDEIHKALDNPFRKPNRRRVLRSDIGGNLIEVYSEYNIGEYNIKYIRRPSPIILSNLDDLTIEGLGTASECELDPMVHETILERAVRLALISRKPQA